MAEAPQRPEDRVPEAQAAVEGEGDAPLEALEEENPAPTLSTLEVIIPPFFLIFLRNL